MAAKVPMLSLYAAMTNDPVSIFSKLKKEADTALAKEESNIESISRQTLQELIDSAYQNIRSSLAQ